MTEIREVPMPGITVTCPHCGYQQRKNLPFLRAYFRNGEKGSIICLRCFKGFEVKLIGTSIHQYHTTFKKSSEERIQSIQDLQDAGKTIKEICKILNMSSATVCKYSKKNYTKENLYQE